MSDQDDTPRWRVDPGQLIALSVGARHIGSAFFDPPTELTRIGSWNVVISVVTSPNLVVQLPVVNVRQEEDARRYLAGIAALITGKIVHVEPDLAGYTACEGADAEAVSA